MNTIINKFDILVYSSKYYFCTVQ